MASPSSCRRKFTNPGEVAAFYAPKNGVFDIGRYPGGTDGNVERLCEALNASGFIGRARTDVMNSKYRKLISNLGNIVRAAFADADLQKTWLETVRLEGERVLTTAGIGWDKGADSIDGLGIVEKPIPGFERLGSSTMQSAVRATGSLETDYLNGEIVLLARLQGSSAPANAAFCALAQKLASGEIKPHTATEDIVTSAMASF